VRISSAPDGTWKYTTLEPVDSAWLALDFDDSGWSAMVRRDARRPPANPNYDSEGWEIERLTKEGAAPLGFDTEASRIWVRKRFHIHRAEEAKGD
jgi:hypothetical protein